MTLKAWLVGPCGCVYTHGGDRQGSLLGPCSFRQYTDRLQVKHGQHAGGSMNRRVPVVVDFPLNSTLNAGCRTVVVIYVNDVKICTCIYLWIYLDSL